MEKFNESTIHPVSFSEEVKNSYKDIITNEAMDFLVQLHEKFNSERLELLERRVLQQMHFDKGNFPEFPRETVAVREGDWTAAPLPKDLLDRRVEITGPVDRKMIINALNSGAKVFMADFEDSNSPIWNNLMEGQQNLKDAVNKTISFSNEIGKEYKLNATIATLLVRPRGLHLNEKHLLINEEPMSGSLVDFGLYFFHNVKQLLANESGPYFYLPKLEHYLEARWWNEVFVFSQEYFGIKQATIKATVLIETITASFQIDEIIFELKDHMAGLNCGRWDYIFSYIKKFRNHKNFTVPDRSQVTMATPFMEAYSLLVIQRCHKRNVHAIGGMAAQIPVKNDEEANRIAYEKVRIDKEREAKNGHDGTWVAHPGLVPVALEVFNQYMPEPNQIDKKRDDFKITESQLLEQPKGMITEEGIRKNINVGILYLESWLTGNGAAALYNLMEDAATAEISRTQLWQWLHNMSEMEDGRKFTVELYIELLESEIHQIKELVGENEFENGKFKLAIELFDSLVVSEKFEEFLTLKAYKYL
ncbi:MAG: malate synthase A [Lutibacter sp.]|nr:malate synthase A [Lutibacter sp.]MDP3945897.1 malate synthase A [Lutibacter sp.]